MATITAANKRKPTLDRKPRSPGTDTIKIWRADAENYFLRTYSKGSAVRMPPPAFSTVLHHPTAVAAGSYYINGNKKGNTNTFWLKTTNVQELRAIAKQMGKKLVLHNLITAKDRRDLFNQDNYVTLDAQIDKLFNIAVRHIDLGGPLNKALQFIERDDVYGYGKDAKANKLLDIPEHYRIVNQLVDAPQFFPIQPKPTTLIKLGKGYWHNCPFEIGINDAEGCLTNLLPTGYYDSSQLCDYCYATHQNIIPYTTTKFAFDLHQFNTIFAERIIAEKLNPQKPLVVRMGQNTEVNPPSAIRNLDGFVDTLPIILEFFINRKHEGLKDSLAMPTKTPEYDKQRAQLFRQAGLSLLVSIVDSSMEPGILNWGFTTERRLEEAYKHAEAGVPTTLYLGIDITRGPEHFNEDIKNALQFYENHPHTNLHLSYLERVVTKGSIAPHFIGKSWNQAKIDGSYVRDKRNNLVPTTRHHYFTDAIKQGAGLCSTHTPKNIQACFNCNMHKYKNLTAQQAK